MPHNSLGQISGVDDQTLASVIGYLPSLPNLQADESARFAQAVRSIVEGRAQNGWLDEDDHQDEAVFVMVDHPRAVGQKLGANEPFADLVATNEPLLGRIFFGSLDASRGRFMSLPVKNSNSILEWLCDNNLSDCPIVIVYRTKKVMATRPSGANDAARLDPIRDTPPTATINELLDALNYFHIHHLLTPSCGASGVWESKRANSYVPGPQPEKSIQANLALALNHWFHGIVKAETEDSTSIGRIDVRLLKKSSEHGALSYWAIIELKIIKSFANASIGKTPTTVSSKANIEALIKGIEQTWAFKANREAEEGLLEVFDLRQDKLENLMERTEVVTALTKCSPISAYNVRPLFGSSDDARKAGFTGV